MQVQKVPYLECLPLLHDANLTPVWSHVGNQLPRFPKATCPHPFLKPAHPSYKSTCNTFFNYEDDIDTL
jgi:hypothetical protein